MPPVAPPAPRPARPVHHRALVAVVVVAVVAVSAWVFVSGRSGVEAAPAGGDPACGRLLEELPDRLAGAGRTPQAAAGVAVWGQDRVVLRCGAAVIGPTTAPCLPVGPDEATSVDWVQDATSEQAVRFLTYGREPAVEVTVRYGGGLQRSSATSVLVDLAAPVVGIPQQRRCA